MALLAFRHRYGRLTVTDENTPDKVKEELPFVKTARNNLTNFLERHPGSKVTGFVPEDGKELVILARPWNDSSIALSFSSDETDIIDHLNSIYFPSRFRAIYHTDLKMLEIFWTAWKLDDEQKEIRGRKFTFSFKGREHQCVF